MTRDILIFVTDLISFVKSCKMLCLSPFFKVWIIFLNRKYRCSYNWLIELHRLNQQNFSHMWTADVYMIPFTAIFRVIDLCWKVAFSSDANTVLTVAVILSDGYTAVALSDLIHVQLCWLQAHRDPSGRSGSLILSFWILH